MSTRAYIGMEEEDGKVVAIYLHNDGYPSGVGEVLADAYASPARVRELLALGDCSALDRNLGQRQDFDHPVEGWSLFYGRDRREEGAGATTYSDRAYFLAGAEGADAQYAYLYRGDRWECSVARWELGVGSVWRPAMPLDLAIREDREGGA